MRFYTRNIYTSEESCALDIRIMLYMSHDALIDFCNIKSESDYSVWYQHIVAVHLVTKFVELHKY